MPQRALLLVFILLGLISPAVAAPSPRPNIIIIYADDMGYGDPGCYGGKLVGTPAIDALARDGVRCTDGYVTAPVCGPSRVGLITGAYPQRFGVQWNQDGRLMKLPPKHQILPQALRQAGYVTGLLGKWNFPPRPAGDVFDEARDVMDWEGDYFPDEHGHYTGVDEPKEHASAKVQGIWGPQRPDDEYLTDRIGRHAVEFIDRHRDKPFFLYLAFNAVHTPLHAKKADRERFSHVKPEALQFYAAMVASMDENIARVLSKLDDAGLTDNTLVVFASDNGPAKMPVKVWPKDWPVDFLLGSAGPLAGHKAQFLEGGIREPFIFRWPAKLKAGQVYRQPISTLDLYATCCAAAGIEVPDGTHTDGVNLLPYLRGQQTGAPHDILFWKLDDRGAVRQGDWKLVLQSWKPKRQLFNLADDIGEQHDLSDQHPELTGRLHQAWLDWSAPFPPRANPKK
ncbi:sulfatase-like hydrolase/transferase [Planctomycetales bacterium ZRK34]|nr:sulfatase-like hydrolase/transferase [Planctomycetales bacterium ZRK34]